jgi:hypothetical protein
MAVLSDNNITQEQAMEIVNPDNLRLIPGQSIQAIFSPEPGEPGEVGFFVRTVSEMDQGGLGLVIQQRAGLVKFNDILLVLTMFRVEGKSVELFDVWWNYFANGSEELFSQMSRQKRLTLHFYSDMGKHFPVGAENGFRRFFLSLPEVLRDSEPWTEVEFDRAVRGFCAQSYPKEKLWDMIQLRLDLPSDQEVKERGIEDYAGYIPEELWQFYDYIPGQGHCLRVIPSAFEEKALEADPRDFLFPAPVKTVLRCGLRWIKGYPVAPIPFIPGHGLAVPPDDTEL